MTEEEKSQHMADAVRKLRDAVEALEQLHKSISETSAAFTDGVRHIEQIKKPHNTCQAGRNRRVIYLPVLRNTIRRNQGHKRNDKFQFMVYALLQVLRTGAEMGIKKGRHR